MRVEAFFTAAEVEPGMAQGGVAVVIDVLRATSSIVEALAAGARAVYPAVGTEEALKLASSLGRDDTLLCGERRGLKVEGFDLGNSPLEFSADRVGGKRLVMSTTNGTRALHGASGAERVLVASLLNLSAVTAALGESDDIVVVCAGRGDRFALEDAVCAGLLLNGLVEADNKELRINDAGLAAMELARALPADPSLLRSVRAGRALIELDLGQDIEHCAKVDLHEIVPVMRDLMICVDDVS